MIFVFKFSFQVKIVKTPQRSTIAIYAVVSGFKILLL